MNLVHQQLNPSFQAEKLSPQQCFFAKHCAQIEQTLNSHQQVTLYQACHALNAALKEHGLFSASKRILCIGFTQISPVLQAHLHALANHHHVHFLTPTAFPQNVHAHAFSTLQEEQHAMLDWAMSTHSRKPNDTITVLSMGPMDKKNIESLYHVFDQEVLKDNVHITHFETLNHYPIIACALQLLKIALSPPPLSAKNWIDLLENPFLGQDHSHQNALHNAAKKLWQQGHLFYANTASCPLSANTTWQAFLHWQKKRPKAQPLLAWHSTFQALLDLWAWPGPNPLDSHNIQAIKAWHKTIAQWQRLAIYLPPEIDAQKALDTLLFCASEQTFQPKEEQTRPIQIMPFDNFLGLNSDHLWVMQSQAHLLPPPPLRNDYLPEDYMQDTHDPMNTLLHSSSHIVFSAHQHNQDIPSPISRRILPLITDYQMTYSNKFPDPLRQQHVADQPIRQGLKKPSAHVLHLYGECPFRGAFEPHLDEEGQRLHMGISPQERGNLVHLILHHFWQNIKTHACLIALDEVTLNQQLDDIICPLLRNLQQRMPTPLPKAFWQQEKKRLLQLIDKWLIQERLRPPFEIVATELPIRYTLERHVFSLRLDRLDRDENGLYWIIDYKTGNMQPSLWFDKRLTQPQMPLYALAVDKPLAGLLYGIVRPDNQQYKGLTNQETLLSGIAKLPNDGSWQDALKQWHNCLHHQLNDYQNGIHPIDPNTPSSCQYCHLQATCRHHLL